MRHLHAHEFHSRAEWGPTAQHSAARRSSSCAPSSLRASCCVQKSLRFPPASVCTQQAFYSSLVIPPPFLHGVHLGMIVSSSQNAHHMSANFQRALPRRQGTGLGVAAAPQAFLYRFSYTRYSKLAAASFPSSEVDSTYADDRVRYWHAHEFHSRTVWASTA